MLPWHFVEVTDIERIKNQLTAEIERIAAVVDDEAERRDWQALQQHALQRIWDNPHDEVWDNL